MISTEIDNKPHLSYMIPADREYCVNTAINLLESIISDENMVSVLNIMFSMYMNVRLVKGEMYSNTALYGYSDCNRKLKDFLNHYESKVNVISNLIYFNACGIDNTVDKPEVKVKRFEEIFCILCCFVALDNIIKELDTGKVTLEEIKTFCDSKSYYGYLMSFDKCVREELYTCIKPTDSLVDCLKTLVDLTSYISNKATQDKS